MNYNKEQIDKLRMGIFCYGRMIEARTKWTQNTGKENDLGKMLLAMEYKLTIQACMKYRLPKELEKNITDLKDLEFELEKFDSLGYNNINKLIQEKEEKESHKIKRRVKRRK